MSRLLVLDVDPRNGGDRTLAELIAKHGQLPETIQQFTGGGGRLPEEYIPGPGGARKGSSLPDITAQKNGKTLYTGTYAVDTAKKPAHIDFRNTGGGLKGTWKGIFELEGDALRTCDNAPDMTKPRPVEFAAPAGSGYIFIVFRRDRP